MVGNASICGWTTWPGGNLGVIEFVRRRGSPGSGSSRCLSRDPASCVSRLVARAALGGVEAGWSVEGSRIACRVEQSFPIEAALDPVRVYHEDPWCGSRKESFVLSGDQTAQRPWVRNV
jgi:hypothetical protein